VNNFTSVYASFDNASVPSVSKKNK